jgi:hypothetical protein
MHGSRWKALSFPSNGKASSSVACCWALLTFLKGNRKNQPCSEKLLIEIGSHLAHFLPFELLDGTVKADSCPVWKVCQNRGTDFNPAWLALRAVISRVVVFAISCIGMWNYIDED